MQDLSASVSSVIHEVIEPQAIAVDRDGSYPRAGLDALAKIGVLGLLSAPEVGGMGRPLRDAAAIVEKVGGACGSTGMVLCMHYVATMVIEGHGQRAVREAIAAGRHVTTLALSEAGTRSHFWVPVSTATLSGDHVRLDAHKSMTTSAGEADSYVWSSRPIAEEGLSTLWLVPSKSPGLHIPARFEGFGLRGNASSPIKAEGLMVPRDAMLGPDGGGYEIMMGPGLTTFQVLSSACYLGITEAATAKTVKHVTSSRLDHLEQSLADLPTIRANVARMRLKTDMLRTLLADTLSAIEDKREDQLLRTLEIKAAAGETAADVTALAMRVCGGAAFAKQGGIERHYRDAAAANVMSATTDLLYEYIGRAVCGLPLT